MNVGDTVKAKIDLLNDLTDHGMGIECCAKAGDLLVIRELSKCTKNRFYVSHQNITTKRFSADAHELELVTPKQCPGEEI